MVKVPSRISLAGRSPGQAIRRFMGVHVYGAVFVTGFKAA
jgi:hypothetical protein